MEKGTSVYLPRKYLIHIYKVHIIMDCTMNAAPYLKKRLKVTGQLFFSLIRAMTMLADAPINVPFPPRHAPSANDHHSGWAICVCIITGSDIPDV
jgi:hypothetical protein